MKLSGKAIGAILVVAVLTGLLIFSQLNPSSSSGHRAYNLSAHDMEVLVGEIMPPPQQQALAASAEQKQTLAKRLKELLALAQVAEEKEFDKKPDVQSQISLQTDLALRDAYDKKNPGVKLEDDEVNKYLADHPKEFDSFLEANPQFKQQAQGPQAEGMKKEFAQIKIIANRARTEKLDQDEAFQLRALLERSNVLARAYVTDLQEGDKLVNDADVDKYYKEHPEEFEEVRARHILISTEADADAGAGDKDKDKDKKDADKKPKTLTKEEAKKKAQAILDRIRKGEDFAKLAEENSADPGSKTKGGDLGYFTKGAMVPEFDKAAFSLKPGEVSELIETSFGYHIIKVEDHRTKPITDEATKKQITDKVKQKKIEDHIKEIAEKSSVQVAEDFNVTPKPMEPQPQMQLPTPDQGAQPVTPPPAPKPAPGKTDKPTGAKNKQQ
jgi:parvulin-like peptidyl-prolyl isomerase